MHLGSRYVVHLNTLKNRLLLVVVFFFFLFFFLFLFLSLFVCFVLLLLLYLLFFVLFVCCCCCCSTCCFLFCFVFFCQGTGGPHPAKNRPVRISPLGVWKLEFQERGLFCFVLFCFNLANLGGQIWCETAQNPCIGVFFWKKAKQF